MTLIRVFDNSFPESVHSEVWNNVNPINHVGHLMVDTTTRIWHMDNLEKDPFFQITYITLSATDYRQSKRYT